MKHQTHQKKHVLEISKTREDPLLELNVQKLVSMLARAITMAVAIAIQLTTPWGTPTGLTGDQHARALRVITHN